MDYPVGAVEEIQAAGRRLVELDGRTIGVLSVGDRFYALRDSCPHRGASMCRGTVSGTFVESDPQEFVESDPQEYVYGRHERVIRCPWHGWEFDLDTGRSLLEPDTVRVRIYPTSVRDGTVLVHI